MAGRTPRRNERPDHDGTHRLAFERNKKKIYATQTVCGICGKPVDFSCKFPHPLSPCIDHIIPVAKGGHPSDLANLQLAHLSVFALGECRALNGGNVCDGGIGGHAGTSRRKN